MAKKYKEIRIRGTEKLANDLGNIAGNLGVSLADFLRPKLRDIANQYPEDMRNNPPIES
jgi:hypothetical protein